jgi:hypothetical protein
MTDGTPGSGLGSHHGQRQQEIIAMQGSTSGGFRPQRRTGAADPMDPAVSPDERDPSVVAVAAVSLLAALACTLAHAATARLAGIDTSPGVVRAVGLVDLALALAAVRRTAVVAVAAGPRRIEPGDHRSVAGSARSRCARLLATGLAVATASDVRTPARLRAARR